MTEVSGLASGPSSGGGVSLGETTRAPVADLVLEGGGVRGLGLVGAIQGLADAGYTVARVAGTSAGAIVGAVVAALHQRGESLDRLEEIARTLDYRRVRDRGGFGRLVGGIAPLAAVADGIAILLHDGAYRGVYLRDWVRGVLADLQVRTFGDLRLSDPGGDGSVHHRYRLVVVASDLSRRRVAQLPWDYEELGLDPDEQSVADAVRASAATPYLFRPSELAGRRGVSTLVDGGLVANYPVGIFDRVDGRAPRWPTIGVRLDDLGAATSAPRAVRSPIPTGVALIETAIEANLAARALAPCNQARSIKVDTSSVSSFDFDLTEADRERLVDEGRAAASRFLDHWDFDRWVRDCRS